mmetsp:Transcript_7899/g.22623  ORF Transcript_7899/g.22623 Transcript_7899/m.22623 type:complete len:210 (-) Transcript_7899:328-957(-)
MSLMGKLWTSWRHRRLLARCLPLLDFGSLHGKPELLPELAAEKEQERPEENQPPPDCWLLRVLGSFIAAVESRSGSCISADQEQDKAKQNRRATDGTGGVGGWARPELGVALVVVALTARLVAFREVGRRLTLALVDFLAVLRRGAETLHLLDFAVHFPLRFQKSGLHLPHRFIKRTGVEDILQTRLREVHHVIKRISTESGVGCNASP